MSCRRSGVGERTGRMEADGSGGLSSYQLAALRANMAAAPPPAASGHFHNRAHAPSGFPWQRRLLSNGREVAGPGLGARAFAPDRRPWDSSREGRRRRRRRRRAVEAKGRGAEPPGVRVGVLAGSPARVRESREPRLGGGGGASERAAFPSVWLRLSPSSHIWCVQTTATLPCAFVQSAGCVLGIRMPLERQAV